MKKEAVDESNKKCEDGEEMDFFIQNQMREEVTKPKTDSHTSSF